DYPGEPASSPAQTTVARARSGDGKVPTAPLGSRNAPDGSDKVIATPQRGLEPSGRSKIGGDLTPKSMHPAQVRVELEAAEDRDVIFGLLLRAIRHHTDYAGLLTVQGGAAIGRIAISGDRVDREDVGAVLIPLDSPSAFLNVINSGSPHIGPVATGDPEIDAMIMRMGQIQALPPSALLLPILLRNRVVAVAVGHCGEQPVDVGAVSELLPLAGVAAEAISRLIMKNKAQRAAQAAAADARDPADGEPSRADIDYAEPSSGSFDEDSGRFEQAPTPPFVKPLIGSRTMSIEAEDPQPISAVLTAAEDSETDIAEPAKAEATARAEETLHALFHGRFPGRLDIDRYELGGRSLPPAQHGPLLDVVMRIGPPAYRMLVAKMRDGDRDIRYYATACVAEMHLRGAIPTLIERLFDSDYGIRNAAINALSAFPGRDLDQSLTRVRQALHSSKEDRVQAAANSLASLADIRSIPDLLTAHERGDKSAEHAHRALVQLTKQDYGASNRKWRMWWSKHKHRHRIEWLLDGLSNKDERIRRSSVETLRTLTGEYFDYQYDHPKKDREHGRQRWQDWWAEIGRRRFIKSDENHRSTAVLPGKS
ncbi:MAG: HEAT repeat domain-containing protein, partial [Myxococcota bacterium]